MESLTIGNATILQGNCLETLKQIPDESVQCCVTSPPYWGLRDYGHADQLGMERTPEEYVAKLVAVFREVRRALKNDGILWLNLGDCYSSGGRGSRDADPKHAGRTDMTVRPDAGLKPKDLVGIPWMVAFALRADGWYLRQEIIWHKPNPMPESVTDRCTKSHEQIFLLSKSPAYFYDHAAIKEPAICCANGSEFHTGKTGEHQLGRAQKVRPSVAKGGFAAKDEPLPGQLPFRAVTEYRNKRSVWEVSTVPYPGAHFAVYPPKLIEPCILAGARVGDTVLDPFNGSGTTGIVALKHDRLYIGCELNPEYVAITLPRIEEAQSQLKLALGC